MESKRESKKTYSSIDFGDFILLPTSKAEKSGQDLFVQSVAGRDGPSKEAAIRKQYIKDGEIHVDGAALIDSATNYQKATGKKLVHVLSEIRHLESKESLNQGDIQYFIANLYFLVAQGKSICIPVRLRGATGKEQRPDTTGYRPELRLKHLGKYEYAFGGEHAPNFFEPMSKKSTETYFEKLEKELNELNHAINHLQEKGERQLAAILKIIPEKYRKSFKEGLTSKEDSLDRSKYQNLSTQSKSHTGMTSADPVWKKFKSKDFIDFFAEKNHTVKKIGDDKNHIQIYPNGQEKQKVDMKKNEYGYVDISTNQPSMETYQIMTDAMKFAGVEEVTIYATGFENDKARIQALDILWLQSTKQGLRVMGYKPSPEFLKEYQKKRSASESDLKGEEEDDTLKRKKKPNPLDGDPKDFPSPDL